MRTVNRRRYSRRRRNPVARRRSVRRRNPAITGLLVKGLWVGGGVFATDMLQSLIPIPVSSPIVRIGIRAGTAYLIGAVGGRFVGPGNAELMALGGLAGAAQDLIRLLWGGFGSVFTPAPQLPAGPSQGMIDSGDAGVGMIQYAPEGYAVRG